MNVAIEAVNAERSEKNNLAFQNALARSVIYVAAEKVPEAWRGTLILDKQVFIPVLTSGAPGGGVALLCFSDIAHVRARTGSDTCFGLQIDAINNLVKANGYAGIIVNPSGPWVGLPAAQLDALATRFTK